MTKDLPQSKNQEWSYWYISIASKTLNSLKSWSFNVHGLVFKVQFSFQRPSPAFKIQSSAPSAHSLASSVLSVQTPESKVQRTETSVQGSKLASRVQEFRYAFLPPPFAIIGHHNWLKWTRSDKTSQCLSLHETIATNGVIATFVQRKYPLGIPYDAFNPAVKDDFKKQMCSISGCILLR